MTMTTTTNGNRQIRQLAKPRRITHGPLKGEFEKWEGAINGWVVVAFVDEQDGTAEQHARGWLAWQG